MPDVILLFLDFLLFLILHLHEVLLFLFLPGSLQDILKLGIIIIPHNVLFQFLLTINILKMLLSFSNLVPN